MALVWSGDYIKKKDVEFSESYSARTSSYPRVIRMLEKEEEESRPFWRYLDTTGNNDMH